MPSSRITSLLEELEFTPPSSARTKGDIYVPGTYTSIFFLIFRLMRYTYVFFFSLSGVLFRRENIIPQLNETVKHDKIREEPEKRVLLYTVISYYIPDNIVFKDAPWPCRGGGGWRLPPCFCRQTSVRFRQQ